MTPRSRTSKEERAGHDPIATHGRNGVAKASPGRPLDASTQTAFGIRFGHDFSRVRIHADIASGDASRAEGAVAYTVGNDIYVDSEHIQLATQEGLRLLAHELTHVVQQSAGPGATEGDAEREALENASRADGSTLHVQHGVAHLTLQRQDRVARPRAVPLDADAEKIVAVLLPNPSDKRDKQTKAVEFVYRILNKYFAGYASKVSGVGFDNKQAKGGLAVVPRQSPTTKEYFGFIWVGDSFVNEIINNKEMFADQVAKVAHELEHIAQWRDPKLAGPTAKNEREFLAHAHESAFIEPAGAGKMHHSSRARHIDAALGLYCCFDDTLKTRHLALQQELLRTRPKEAKYGHSEKFPNPPTTCTQPDAWGFE
jgi:hypothetical protein